MSLSSAIEFIERMKSDDSLWFTHKAIRDKNEHKSLIKQAGYDFTEEELKTALDVFIKDLLRYKNSKYHTKIG